MTTVEIAPPTAEAALWTILLRFEAHALTRYREVAPELATDQKRALVDRLSARNVDADLGPLDGESTELINLLSTGARSETLINQGLLLELVGKAIYVNVGDAPVSEATRELCALGARAADDVVTIATGELRKAFPTSDDFFAALIKTSPDLLRRLTPFSETLDHEIGPAFGLSFADLIGEFVAEVDDVTQTLGVDRKKLIAFLTNVMMET